MAKLSLVNLSVAAVASAALSLALAFISASICRRKSRLLSVRIKELEASLEASSDIAASERRGRIKAQQALRLALVQQSSDGLRIPSLNSAASYPMVPIAFVRSCFSARNGTPRQPLVVPLSRACLMFDSCRVPAAALDGLSGYSHCWVLYIFHLNTDLEKLWKQTSRSKFKAKVRVPRLNGGKMGVLATRSPHRPCPIGLSVAKIEALEGHALLLSGVDLVDGTPVLDVKPYLPYSDSIQEATIPKWLKEENALVTSTVGFSTGFKSTLSDCWLKNLQEAEMRPWLQQGGCKDRHLIAGSKNFNTSVIGSGLASTGPPRKKLSAVVLAGIINDRLASTFDDTFVQLGKWQTQGERS